MSATILTQAQTEALRDRLLAAELKAETAERAAAHAIASEQEERNRRMKLEQDLALCRWQLEQATAAKEEYRVARDQLLAQFAQRVEVEQPAPIRLGSTRRLLSFGGRINGAAVHLYPVLPADRGMS